MFDPDDYRRTVMQKEEVSKNQPVYEKMLQNR
jgi:hypothetical protein